MDIQSYPWGVPEDIIKKAYKKSSAYVLAKLSLLSVIWMVFGLFIIHSHSLFIKITLWFVLGYFINGLVQLVHDSWHQTLFHKRWQNRLLGHFLSFLFFVLYHPPRHGHMLHHRYNRTEKDPDAYNAGEKSWDLVLIYYAVFLFGVPLAVIHFNLLYPLQFYNRKQLIYHFMQLGLLIVLQVVVWTLIVNMQLWSIAWQVWLMPVLFTSFWNGMKSVADHYQNDWEGNPLRTATTVRSNVVTTYLWNGLNYHLEHHLFPGVPGYNLSKLHPYLQDLFKSSQSSIFSSYFRVWISALLRGPELIDREGKFNPFQLKGNKND